MKKEYCLIFSLFVTILQVRAQPKTVVSILLRPDQTFQTIQNFGASDAWACQFAGNWPEAKKNQMADWLFSLDTTAQGDPKGIGLSLWRYNFGAGSAEQKDSSSIRDSWRRAALSTSTSTRVQSQQWFVQAAHTRGVQQFLGFFNSPPVEFTRNRKAFATGGKCNIDSNDFAAFADYTVHAIDNLQQQTHITLNYLSPVNEPQWDWSDGGQEGCPYTNDEIGGLVRAMSSAFVKRHISTKIVITESGQLDYLLAAHNRQDKDQQIRDFFTRDGANYVNDLPSVAPVIASHSYFTTSPIEKAIKIRSAIRDAIDSVKGLNYWQSEYCILGDNAGEINGSGKDTGMNAALYVAKVIYEDLAFANAAAWQWWTAISAYNYKDGLIYIEKKEHDGEFSDSKILWALGNYSRFVRPGMQRIGLEMPQTQDLLATAYMDTARTQIVCVLINTAAHSHHVAFEDVSKLTLKPTALYLTDKDNKLSKSGIGQHTIELPAKSVATVVLE